MENTQSFRFDLTRFTLVRQALRSRWLQFILRTSALAGFVLVILSGFLGSPVGSRNFAIIFVWIGWWTVLKLILLPLGGRSWCSICPIPMPGEWLQQGWLIKPGSRGLNLGLHWPRRLRNNWLQAAGFAAIGLFSAVTLTSPVITAWVLLGFILLALIISILFEKRSFCRYLCPMGGYISMYSSLAPLELRPKNNSPIRYQASHEWPRGCPWINNPASLKANTNCGLCLECLRTPSGGEMVLNARSFNAEISQPNSFRLDEAILSFVLLSSAFAFTTIFQGTWTELQNAVFNPGTPAWWYFSIVFLLLSFGIIPGLFYGVSALTRHLGELKQPTKIVFSRFSRGLLPLELFVWIAFTVSFSFGKLAYLWPVISDPFGWGWNLFGTASLSWKPYLVSATPFILALLLAAGLFWSLSSIQSTARHLGLRWENRFATLPIQLFALAITLGMLWLLIG